MLLDLSIVDNFDRKFVILLIAFACVTIRRINEVIIGYLLLAELNWDYIFEHFEWHPTQIEIPMPMLLVLTVMIAHFVLQQ